MTFTLRLEALTAIRDALTRRGGTLTLVTQVKSAKKYRLQLTADLSDGSSSMWRSDYIKYPKGQTKARDWSAEAKWAAAWRPSSSSGSAVLSTEDARRGSNDTPPPPRGKRPRDCQPAAEILTPPPKRPGYEGAGRPKGTFGRKRLRAMLDRYRERIELGQVTCGRLEVRDLSSAMLDAAQEVEKHEQDWRPAFLKRQSNRDVLKYRVETYLPAYFEHRDYTEIWIDASMEEVRSWEVETQPRDMKEDGRVWVCVHAFAETLSEFHPDLRARVTSKKKYADGRRAIFCYQDECIYRAHDGESKAWWPPMMHGLKKKGEGQGIMISGTIVGDVGFVEGTQDDIDKAQDLRRERCRISEEKHAAGDHTRPEKYRDINMLYFEGEGDDRKFSTYYKFEYGKNKEGYWTGEKMIEHMADVLDLLAVKFPRHRPICFFDWSSCHDCVEEGAPSVTRMNAGYGGVRKGQEIAPQNATTILEDTPKLKVGAVQHLTFQQGEYPFYEPGATDHVGKVKGMKQILFERGLWIPGMTMSGGKTGQEPNKKMSMPAVLRAQKDFANVDSSLEVLLKRHGGVALMLPKFHCELNPIELVWGRSKWWVRRNCKYTIACLRENVSKSYGVHNLSLDIVQKFCRKVANFHAVYDAGLTGAEAVEAQEKCKSHRKPAPSEYINPK
ncbi:unnamed protein product [Ectocarpus sp. CCAP 1310/34]|nr:unnamed protein product [Ectocarpus sp. CCAP 1310/34]